MVIASAPPHFPAQARALQRQTSESMFGIRRRELHSAIPRNNQCRDTDRLRRSRSALSGLARIRADRGDSEIVPVGGSQWRACAGVWRRRASVRRNRDRVPAWRLETGLVVPAVPSRWGRLPCRPSAPPPLLRPWWFTSFDPDVRAARALIVGGASCAAATILTIAGQIHGGCRPLPHELNAGKTVTCNLSASHKRAQRARGQSSCTSGR